MKTRLLTYRKKKWVESRRPDVIRGTPLNPSVSAALRYEEKLDKPIKRMMDETAAEIRALFASPHGKEYFAQAQDASISSQARILMNALSAKFDEVFATLSKPLAEKMVDEADAHSSLTLHSSLEQLSGGMSLPTTILTGELNDIVKAAVSENVSLIRSIPAKYLTEVEGAVYRSITTGRGLKDLVPFLEKQKGITYRRARMIALDQTRKTYAVVNKGRMEKLGIAKYEWLHTGGSDHPRKEHQAMSGKIYSFDDPPVIDSKTGERGIPGQLINCRCRMVPVITFGGDTNE